MNDDFKKEFEPDLVAVELKLQKIQAVIEKIAKYLDKEEFILLQDFSETNPNFLLLLLAEHCAKIAPELFIEDPELTQEYLDIGNDIKKIANEVKAETKSLRESLKVSKFAK